VDLDRTLEAIVEDGDNFWLERMYSYSMSLYVSSISVKLENPDLIPDMTGWSREQIERFDNHSYITYVLGDWTEMSACYNIETSNVEKFDPVSFYPQPATFMILDNMEDYRRLYNWAKKLKAKGYKLKNLELENSNVSPVAYELRLQPEQQDSHLLIDNFYLAQQSLGHLIPGLE
jgi:hypothetical protein